MTRGSLKAYLNYCSQRLESLQSNTQTFTNMHKAVSDLDKKSEKSHNELHTNYMMYYEECHGKWNHLEREISKLQSSYTQLIIQSNNSNFGSRNPYGNPHGPNTNSGRASFKTLLEERNLQADEWQSKRSVLFTFLSYCVIPFMAILFVIMYPLTFIIDFLVNIFFLYTDPRVQKKKITKNSGSGKIEEKDSSESKVLVDQSTTKKLPILPRSNPESRKASNDNDNSNNNNVKEKSGRNGSGDSSATDLQPGASSKSNSMSKTMTSSGLKKERRINDSMLEDHDSNQITAIQTLAKWQKDQKSKFSRSSLTIQLLFIGLIVVALSIFYFYFVLKSGSVLSYLIYLCQKLVELLQKFIYKYTDDDPVGDEVVEALKSEL